MIMAVILNPHFSYFYLHMNAQFSKAAAAFIESFGVGGDFREPDCI